MNAEQIINEALQLPPNQRERIADELYLSLDEDMDPAIRKAWEEEFARRVAAYEAGETSSYSRQETRRILLERLHERRKQAASPD